jgi:hypothetical protein
MKESGDADPRGSPAREEGALEREERGRFFIQF